MDLSQILDEQFRFKIGERVAHTAYDTEATANPPIAGVVVERILQQCHGGIQKFYRCRAGAQLVDFIEFELVPFAEALEQYRAAKEGETQRWQSRFSRKTEG